MPGRIEFKFNTRNQFSREPHTSSNPMRILLLGDFSAHSLNVDSKHQPAISQRKLHPLDMDTLDQVLSRIAPQITLSLVEGLTACISFSEIDDFHPDTLFRKLPLFDELRDLRARLHNLNTCEEAAVQLRTMLSLQAPATTIGEHAPPLAETKAHESDAATIERLLGRPIDDTAQTVKAARSTVDRLIGDALKEHIVPDTNAGQQIYLDAADQALGDLMRQILHHPGFQTLEALWRSVEFLISRLELNEAFHLSLLDVTKDELMEDVRQAGNELEQTGLYRLLIEQGIQVSGTDPWSLIIGHYSFDNTEDDTRLLTVLGNIGAYTRGPFLAQASATLLGCNSLAETPDPHDWIAVDTKSRQRWDALRASPVAQWIGLVLPRMLLRLPYGSDTDEIDSFAFQEVNDASEHHRFLWGNPAVGCATLIGQAFSERGWQMTPGDFLDIGDLPAFSYVSDGETRIIPCAEVYLTDTAAGKILTSGLMPMLSLHNSNVIRLLRFQSIAMPSQALAGQWT